MDKRAAFASPKIACFTVLCLILGVAETVVFGETLSGSGTATINGTLDPGEWTNAGTADLTIDLPPGQGGGATTGKLYVMNDSSTLYLAVRVDQSLKNATSVFAIIEFDNDNDGVREDGDDLLQTGFSNDSSGSTLLVDRVRVGSDSSLPDTERSGTDDIDGKASLDGTYSSLEISHPLNSADDANDFSLSSGQVVGFKLFFQIWGPEGAETPYPSGGTVDFAQIQISGTTPGPEPLTEKLCFPQFGVGGGLTSQIVLTNPSQQHAATAQLQITDDQGAPATVTFNGMSSGSSVNIPPLGSVTLTAIDTGQLTVGSAVASASRQIGGAIRFEIFGTGIAGVGSSTPVEAFITPVRRTAGGINTGVAIQNLGTTATRLEFSLRSADGETVPEGFYVIESFPAHGHLAKFINELFSEAQLDSFTGTLVVQCSGGLIGAVALELGAKPGELTTLPVVPLSE